VTRSGTEQLLPDFFGGVAGGIPRRGGSGKAEGFEAWGRLPPFLLYVNK
jgi:hypothetical protein